MGYERWLINGTGVMEGRGKLPADPGPQAGPEPMRAGGQDTESVHCGQQADQCTPTSSFICSATLSKFLDLSELQPFIYKMEEIRMPAS